MRDRVAGVGERVDGVRRLGVVRANSIGDYLCTLPALEALRSTYPDAEIVLFGLRWHRAFLTGRPGPVDRVHALPALDGPEGLSVDLTPRAAPPRARLDVVVQMHGGGRESNPFAASLGARVTAGARSPDAAPLDRWIPYSSSYSEIGRLLGIVALVGAAPTTLRPRLDLTDADRAEAARILRPTAPPFVVVHPGANDGRRRWPIDRFVALARFLDRHRLGVVVSGSPRDRDLARALVEAVPAIRDAVGRVSLGGMAALCRRSVLVVGNDTGPLHLARAVGAPTVTLYWAPALGTYGPLAPARDLALVSWDTRCATCGRDWMAQDCGHRGTALGGISAAQVQDAVTQLLET